MAHDNKRSAALSVKFAATSGLRAPDRQFVLMHFQRVRSRRLAVRTVPSPISNRRIRGSILGREFNASAALRIAQAYIRLLSLPEDTSEAAVSVALIGRCEVRIFGGPTDGMPLFWMELFDHGAKASVDSFGCHRLEDASTIFEGFVLQAGRLDEGSGPDGTQAHN